ncbi:MAG: hypothetical protein MUC86_16610, partial [Burkholderiaceae bacterium]|nr:hypothetical protein [Burkholderiaceae bacterium]
VHRPPQVAFTNAVLPRIHSVRVRNRVTNPRPSADAADAVRVEFELPDRLVQGLLDGMSPPMQN